MQAHLYSQAYPPDHPYEYSFQSSVHQLISKDNLQQVHFSVLSSEYQLDQLK